MTDGDPRTGWIDSRAERDRGNDPHPSSRNRARARVDLEMTYANPDRTTAQGIASFNATTRMRSRDRSLTPGCRLDAA